MRPKSKNLLYRSQLKYCFVTRAMLASSVVLNGEKLQGQTNSTIYHFHRPSRNFSHLKSFSLKSISWQIPIYLVTFVMVPCLKLTLSSVQTCMHCKLLLITMNWKSSTPLYRMSRSISSVACSFFWQMLGHNF